MDRWKLEKRRYLLPTFAQPLLGGATGAALAKGKRARRRKEYIVICKWVQRVTLV